MGKGGNMEIVRGNFEKQAMSAKFSIDRNEHGEYSFAATYNMWVGYWMAKVDSGELTGDNAEWINAHN